MIYISIKEYDKDKANRWVVENVDPSGINTFVENFSGDCLISLPDNGSEYTEKMKEKFGFSETKPNLTNIISDS